ncbi:hypothetical protein BDV25DRAFT_170372 [Aspergillus avenaceus]|uniref:Zn(2)-C6 fungal-type domain-containing protein n=1 Tax=Aspergillus avenaceus TaxID=36643 RepID=A0A5N6U9G8_ASPAV|nr:hypothetical protein BDV25DRAFT_170372 [Aspergillus avenaceus]
MSSVGSKQFGKFRLNTAQKRRSGAKQSRKAHNKSRTGCLGCKASRVKCDESRPGCGRCSDRQEPCEYEDLPEEGRQKPVLQEPPLHKLGDWPDHERQEWYSVSRISCELTNDNMGANTSHPYLKGTGGSNVVMTPATHLTKHLPFCVNTSFIHSPQGTRILHQHVLPGCATRPALMHSLFALSARHLYHLQPSQLHERAYLSHSQLAARYLNQELGQGGVRAHNIDLIYATCLIINMTSFVADRISLRKSWVDTPDTEIVDSGLNWFMVQQGMSYLSELLKDNLGSSFWRSILETDGQCSGILSPETRHKVSLTDEHDSVPQLLAELCEITVLEPLNGNPYHIPLLLLSRLFRLNERGASDADTVLVFGPKVPQAYRVLLRQKDERALLLFMLWLMLLKQEDCWWINGRARLSTRQCQAT